MNKKEAQLLNDVALNIIDLAHCLHTGTANEITQDAWQDMFARDDTDEAARKRWRAWKKKLAKYGLSEEVKAGRENHVILKPNAIEVAEGLRSQAQAVLNRGDVNRRYPDRVTIAGRSYNLKVYGRNVRPLNDREYAALKASIEEKGRIEVPVIVDRHGNVVDGKHRLIIADELGIEDVPVRVVDGDEETLHRLAEDLNSCRRQLTKQQLAELKRKRQARAEAQRSELKSLRQIAEDEGVNPMTIRKDLAASESGEEKVRGKDGRVQPARKPTKEETEERRRRVTELVEEEKTVAEIADELGVSSRTIQRDISALGLREPTDPKDTKKEPKGFGIVVHQVRLGETSWLGVDREADPLETCLEAALDCLEQLRERLDERELQEMAGAAHEIVESVLWRLMEAAAVS